MDDIQDEIHNDLPLEEEEIKQEIKTNSKKKIRTKEEMEVINQTRRENLKKGRERMREIQKLGKSVIQEVKPEPEPIPEPIPVKPKEVMAKKAIEKWNDEEDEPLTEREIREYLRLKKIEDDKLKRVYLLKNQKEQEERFRRGHASLFGF